MKAIMKKSGIFLFVLFETLNLFSQEIQIGLNFTGDTTISPFEGIERITELSMEGSATLNQDTSLVRLIMKDENGAQYMIFESYALICPDMRISYENYCDETCVLDQVKPVSLSIQVTDGELIIRSLFYSEDAKQDAELLRYQDKRDIDMKKIETMNEQIGFYGMNWTAGDNGIVSKYYEQKENMFGEGYNLLGFDYYTGGVFEFLGHSEYPKVDPDLVRHFDWRNRHGANNPDSRYWDGDLLGTGWLTSVKDQGKFPTCWACSAVGLTEVIANLYANDTLDYDLSEQNLISCSDAGNCQGGRDDSALVFIKDTGIVTELCFPYDSLFCPTDSCNDKCNPAYQIFSFFDTIIVPEENHDSIRLDLIKHGPVRLQNNLQKFDIISFV